MAKASDVYGATGLGGSGGISKLVMKLCMQGYFVVLCQLSFDFGAKDSLRGKNTPYRFFRLLSSMNLQFALSM